MVKKLFVLLLIFLVFSQYSLAGYVIAGPQIVVDGKTATQLEHKGNVTNVKTSTVREGNALNSFSRFNVNHGNIANLFVPGRAGNLINLVHSEASHINGVLNSIKDGEIGGNVFFLNPHGFMVGPEGVVNVGSLTAVTPTADFMDEVFMSPGSPSLSAVNRIAEGSIPVTDSGLISVAGDINARNDIKLEAGEVRIKATDGERGVVSTGANFTETSTSNRDNVNFSNVVNINGLESGEELAVDNGEIVIAARKDVVNEGVVAANGGDNLDGGSIEVKAGEDIRLNDGSLISARGRGENSDGGEIIVFADQTSEFNSGAVIDARGGASGDGGFIEFSARENVKLAGGQFMAADENGEAGSILIDPQNVMIGSDLNRYGSSSGYFDGEYIQYFSGADFKMEASESITVSENVVISTRTISGSDHLNDDSSGDSGNLEMTAPQITLNPGSKLLAHAIGSDSNGNEYEAGNITLTADMPDNYIQQGYDLLFSTSIDIEEATLRGKNITMTAKATADYSWNAGDYDWVEDELNSEALDDLNQKKYNDLEIIDDELKLTDENNFNVGYAEAAGDSHILVKGNSVIEAEETVDMSTETTAAARIRTGDIAVGISFAYGDLNSKAKLEIEDGVQITSGELNLASLNNAVLDLNTIGYNKTGSYEAGIAVGNADITSLTEIDAGAEISTDNLVISAVNNNSFSTKATSMVGDSGTAGVSAAIFNADTNATAGYAGNQPDGSFQNLTLEALDNTDQNITTASAAVGTAELMKPLLSGGKKAVGYVKGKLGSGSTSSFDQKSGIGDQEGGNKLELAGAVSYADTGQAAEAFIGDDTVLDVDGDIAVSARVRDANLQNRAKSNVTVEADDDSGSTISLSAAFAYGDYDHTARTYTGDSSILTADHLGLRSDVLKPYEKDWTKLDTVGDITGKIGDLMGLTSEGYLTGHARASGSGSSAEDVTIAGSAAYLDFNNDSRAYTGRESEIYLREDDGWTTTLPGAAELTGLPDGFSQLTWETPLQVTANTEVNGVYVSGNLNLILSGEEGTSIGGAYNQVNYTNETRAYILEGTVVEGQEIETDEDSEDEEETEPSYYKPDITVSAEDQENIITISPSAGNGASWGFNGVFSLGKINNITEASIDDEARIKAGSIGIQATDEVINWSLSGAVNSSENVGVGAGIAINDVNTDTRAFIGDNDEKYTVQQGDTLSELAQEFDTTVEDLKQANDLESDTIYVDQELDIPYEQGKIVADQLDINAETKGRIDSLAVAGVGVASSGNNKPDTSGITDNDLQSYDDKVENETGESGNDEKGFGIGISGSVAYNETDLNISAFAEDITLTVSDDRADQDDGELRLQSLNNTDITAGSGAGSLLISGKDQSDFKVGIAGSAAINNLNNTTRAYGENLDIIEADNVDLKALSGGQALAIGVGASLITGGDAKGLGVAGSASVNMTDNNTESYLLDSDLSGSSPEDSDLMLTAYDRIRFGTGAGSLVAGGTTGVGAAVSYNSMDNNVESYLSGTTADDFSLIQIHGLSSYRIGSGAVMAAMASDYQLGGAFVINKINNEARAEIKSDSEITAKDRIDLLAGDTDNSQLNSILADSGSNDSMYDYDGSDLPDLEETADEGSETIDADTGGSSVFTLAGNLQVGGNNLGISFLWNDISGNYTASISDSAAKTTADTGNINVEALADTDITGLALGGELGYGNFSAGGSVIINDVTQNTTAEVDLDPDTEQIIETNQLDITANDKSDLELIAGRATVGGKAALGGAVILNTVDSDTEAAVRGGLLETGGLGIKSAAGQTINSSAYQGSGSLGLALGVAIVENEANHNLTSAVEKGSDIMINDGALKLDTVDDIDIDSEARGYQGGAVVAGAVHATSKRTGDTTAVIGKKNTDEDSTEGHDDVAEQTDIEIEGGEVIIDSERKGKTESFTQAGSGGVINLLNASNSFAEDSGNIRSGLDSNVDITGTMTWYGYDLYNQGTAVDITAIGKPQVSARAEGYNGSLTASAGMAKAKADANLNIEASVDSDSSITAESLSVKAFNQLNNGNSTARSFAQAIGGGVLLGASAAESEALSSLLVKSYIASDVDVNINKDVEILADNNTSQQAEVTGIIAGAAAVGGNLSEARSDSTTVAAAGSVDINHAPVNVGGKEVNVDGSGLNMIIGKRHYKSGLSVQATGSDYNYADSTSGSGGVVAGAAASSETVSNSTTVAEIGNNAVIGRAADKGTGTDGDPDLVNIDDTGDVLAFEGNNRVGNIINLEQIDLTAEHHTLFNSTSGSVQAAVAGMSGAYSRNKVNSRVEANVGENAGLYTADSYYKPALIGVTASNIIDQAGGNKANAKAASGGVINGSAAESKTYITGDTSVNIGDDAVLFAFGVPGKGDKAIKLNTYNSLNIDDEAVLSTGGAVDSPYAETLLQAGSDSRPEADGEDEEHYLRSGVNICNNSGLISFGRIEAGAYTQAQVNNTALVKTYGGIGFAGGKATSIVDTYQDIDLAASSYLLAYNNIDLRAGQKGDGSVYNRVNSSARTEVFNYTAAPLDTSIEAYGEADNNSTLTIGEGAVIDGVSDLTLGSYKGNTSAEGYGVGHNPYLEAIGSKKTGGESNSLSSSNLIMKGEAGAGIFHHRSLTFNADSVDRKNVSSNLYNDDYINPHQQLQEQIDELKEAKEWAESSNDQVEVSRLEGEIQVLTMLQNMMTDSDDQAAIEVDNLFASGGNITVDTDTVSGDGVLNAHGGPEIEIINNTPKHLLLNEILIPDRDTGGEIRFEGAANKALTGLNINDDEGEKTSRVIIKNNSTSGEPAIFLKGGLYNSRGLVDIFNREGSLAMFDQVSSSETRINVPNGAVIVNNPYGMYSITDPMAVWYSEEDLPGTAWEAVQYVASAFYEDRNGSGTINSWLKDPRDWMYNEESDDGDIYATSGGDTYVFGSWFPNVWDLDKEENINHDIELFNGFWMEEVNDYRHKLHEVSDSYPEQDSSEEPALSGQVIGINAETININDKMRAGSPVDWDIKLEDGIDSWLSNDENYDIENGKVVIPTEYYQAGSDISEDEVPVLEYDFGDEELILGNINARGGGYVYLNGEIVSTSPAGEIEVLNGLGNVEINNQSSKPLLLNNINTGSTSEGIIKIVDSQQGKTTWYVNRPGEDIKQYQLNRITNTVRPDTPAREYSQGEVSYSPQEGLRYKWKRRAELQRDLSGSDGWVELTDRREDGDGYSVYNFKTELNPWRWVNKSGDNVTDGRWVNSSLGIVAGDKDDPVFKQDIEGEVTSWDHDRKIIQSDGTIDYETLDWHTSVDWDDWKNKGVCKDLWYYYLPSEVELTVTNSVKADHDIGISFSGSSNASLEVDSDPGLTIGGRIDNIKGDTTLRTATGGSDQYTGSITQHSSALINTRNLNIYADGDIGSITRPVEVNLDGSLTASSNNGDISINAPRDSLLINNVNGGSGNVHLGAAGDLVSSSSTPVNGADISLFSEGGSIGTGDNSLQIQAEGDVSLEGRDGIYLENINGDLRLLKADSGRGDVNLVANDGRIIDAVREREVDEEKQQQLADIWDRLRLTEEQNALDDAEDTTVSPYEQSIERAYDQYWYLIKNGELDEEGNFQLDPEAIDLYRPRLGEGASDTEVQTYAEDKFTDYSDLLDEKLQPGWADEGYQSGFSYSVTDDERNALTEGAVWTKQELEIQINRNALVTEDTQFVGGDLNIEGENIDLQAGGSIGTYREPLVIDLNSEQYQQEGLSVEEKAALAGANLPNDIEIIKDEAGQVDQIKIRRLRPLYAGAREGISTANANGNTFIYNSEGSLNINQVQSSGDLRLLARDDILNYNPLNKDFAISAAGDSSAVVLEAAGGSIGTEEAPLTLKNGYIATGRSKDNLYLEKTEGNLKFNRISAENIVDLSSLDDIEGLQSGLSILADSINFKAGGDIYGKGFENSSGDDSLQVELITGNLTAQAGGDIDLASDKSITTGSVAADNIDLLSRMIMNISDRIAATGTVNLSGSDIYEVDAGDGKGYIEAGILITASDWGQQLNGNNEVEIFQAENNIEGDIGLTNTGALNITGINQNEGNVNILNSGDIMITGVIQTEKGQVKLETDNGSIMNDSEDEQPAIKAGGGLILLSGNGSIGAKNNRIKTQVEQITEAIAEKEIYLAELGGDLNSQLIKSNTSLVDLLASDGDIESVNTEAAESIKMTGAGNMSADSLKADDLILLFTAEDKSATINQASIEETVNIEVDDLQLNNLNHLTTKEEPLSLTIKGGSQEMADSVTINGISDKGFNFTELTADSARIEAEADDVKFLKTRIGSRAELFNRYYNVIANNVNRELFDTDLQLYPQNKTFFLLFNADRMMLTDAMIANYNPDFIINEFSTENNFVRETDRMNQILNNLNDSSIESKGGVPTLFRIGIKRANGGEVVNLNNSKLNLNPDNNQGDGDE